MPTTKWMQERRQQTFWLTPSEEAAFAEACKKRGITKSRALRETVLVMLATLESKDVPA